MHQPTLHHRAYSSNIIQWKFQNKFQLVTVWGHRHWFWPYVYFTLFVSTYLRLFTSTYLFQSVRIYFNLSLSICLSVFRCTKRFPSARTMKTKKWLFNFEQEKLTQRDSNDSQIERELTAAKTFCGLSDNHLSFQIIFTKRIAVGRVLCGWRWLI